MERKFMVYQRRDGFQIAEEATGTRLKNGMEFLARPHKSASWCTAAFNFVIDDNYEPVGEEIIDCSNQPAQVLCFVDGVMKAIDQSRITIEDMIEHADDAISDRNIPAARAWKIDIDAAIEQCHAEALEMDARKEMNFEQAVFYASQIEYFSLSQEEMAMAKARDHAEALEMNEEVNYHDLIADFSWEFQIVGLKETLTMLFAAMDEALEMNRARDWYLERYWDFYESSQGYQAATVSKAHAEALEMDKKVNQALLSLSSNPLSAGWHLHSPTMKAQAINIAHIQALEMNNAQKNAH